MNLEELKSLREGEVVVITKVDERITEYHNYQVGDELMFYKIENDQVYFLRASSTDSLPGYTLWTVSHFSYEICDYIETKVMLRDNKLNELGI